MHVHFWKNFACVCKYANTREIPELCKHKNPFRAHAMSDEEIADPTATDNANDDDTNLPLTTIVFDDPRDLECLSADQRKDVRWLDKTLQPIVATLKAGRDASQQLRRYVLQAKKYLVKHHPTITISQAAAHPVMFGTMSSL